MGWRETNRNIGRRLPGPSPWPLALALALALASQGVAIRSDQSKVETTLLPEKKKPPSTGIVEA
jgi:hypothetical protein